MSLKRAPALAERIFFVPLSCRGSGQAQPPREEQVLAERHKQKQRISARFTDLQLLWLGQCFMILCSFLCPAGSGRHCLLPEAPAEVWHLPGSIHWM